MPTEFARLVLRRAQRSLYLLDGLRQALEDLDRPEIAAVLDLVREDAAAAHSASKRIITTGQRQRRLRILVDLEQLSRLGNTRGLRLARRVAANLDA